MASDKPEEFYYEYSDEGEEDFVIRNLYHEGSMETDSERALSRYAEVVKMEPDKSKWGFKALKKTMKIYCSLLKYKEMMNAYIEMLTYIKSEVTWRYFEKHLEDIMDFVSISDSHDFDMLQEFYQATLTAIEDEAKKERLWFKTNLDLCDILFVRREYTLMSEILKKLHISCQKEDGTDDQNKGRHLLEVYAYELLICTEKKHNENLEMLQLYQKAIAINRDRPYPKIMGMIHEYGGKLHMEERNWAEAAIGFFQGFINYDNLASRQRRIQCLKYILLVNMLVESELDPLANTKTTSPYKNDLEIVAMTNLIAAYKKIKEQSLREY